MAKWMTLEEWRDDNYTDKTKHPDALALGAQRKLLPAGGEARQAVPADTGTIYINPKDFNPGEK